MVIKADANFHTITGRSVVDRDDPVYKKYRKQWKEWPEKNVVGEFPLHLDIEPTNACNLRCPFCATTHNKYNKGFMQEKIWKKVLDEAGENNLHSLKFTYRGEPLLHKDLPKMIAYAKEAGVMDVYFNTNAVLLDEILIKKLINAGLDRISISFEGFDKNTYDKYRVGSDFSRVVTNIRALKNIREELGSRTPLIRIQSVLVPELKGREMEYADFWASRADEVAYLDMKNEQDNPDHRGIIYDWACPMLWQRMAITWDGYILPCVHDIFEWMKFGNISDITIKKAWKSVQESSYRELHRLGNAHKIPACDRCPLRENEIRKIKEAAI